MPSHSLDWPEAAGRHGRGLHGFAERDPGRFAREIVHAIGNAPTAPDHPPSGSPAASATVAHAPTIPLGCWLAPLSGRSSREPLDHPAQHRGVGRFVAEFQDGALLSQG